jgi:outer membrane protein insertion porin family
MVKWLRYIAWSILPLLFSCSANKYLSEGEMYLDDMKVHLSGDLSKKARKKLNYQLESALRPQPVYRLLTGSRPAVWFYHQTYGDSSSISKWIFRRLAEKPSYLSQLDNKLNLKNARYILENEGYFYPNIQSRIDTHRNGVRVHYDISSGKALTIDSIQFEIDGGPIKDAILRQQSYTLIKKGDRLRLDRLEEERVRISDSLGKVGYFYLRPDFLVFQIDTTEAQLKANVFLTLKNNLPEGALQRYTTGEVLVFSNYKLQDTLPEDSLEIQVEQGVTFKFPNKYVKNKPIRKQIFYTPGNYLSRLDHERTLEGLSNLRVYRFINAIPEMQEDSTVDISLFLTPEIQNNIKAEANFVTKSNNFTGPGISLSHLNKNTFGGAEKLEVSLHSSFETQIGGQRTGLSTFEIGVKNNLSIPGIKLPFAKAWDRNVKSPYSTISLAYNFQNRVGQFTLTSAGGSYGIDWKGAKGFSHTFSVLDITFLKTSNISNDFQEEINNNPLVAESFRENFIPEIGYEMTWSPNKNGRKPYYINLDILLAGNASNGLASLFQDKGTSYDLLGVPISQYARLFIEGRHYWYDRGSSLVVRFLGGLGIAYGNSNTLPYQRQFFAGGTNSIRAFPNRLIGPGAHPPSTQNNNLFIDQSGDIRLEGNVEYRFDLNSLLELALFVDAGNVWLLDEDPERPGGQFTFSEFGNQLAIGTGLGVRLDFNYFLLRFDLAFPLRVPYRSAGDRWVADKIAPFQGAWIRDNLILNVAIGYPF